MDHALVSVFFTFQVEPTLMEAHHMLPEDEQLRVTDAPERLQLARGRDPEQADAADAAECVSWAVLLRLGEQLQEPS